MADMTVTNTILSLPGKQTILTPLKDQLDDDSARIAVTHPEGGWTELVHRATATGIRAVLESSRGNDVRVKLSVSRGDRAIYDCSWA